MAYFTEFVGRWEIPLEDDDLELTKTTSSSFSHLYDVFTIYEGYSNGQIAFARSVVIANESGGGCSAVLYENQKSRYFFGKPDKTSKVFVMQSLHPKAEMPDNLIIDFSGCPKKPPTFTVSKQNKEANKAEEAMPNQPPE